MKKAVTMLLLHLFIMTSVCLAQTSVLGGNVSGTWLLNNSPYLIYGDITIPNDLTLIIEPGVTVEFQGYFSLDVQGCLVAVGTETDSIFFTVNDTTGFHNSSTTLGGWNGIQFIDTPTQNDTSKFTYCNIEYGKAIGTSLPDKSGGAIFISNFNKVVVSNCLIRNCSADGSDSPSGGAVCLLLADIILEDNEFSYNHAWDGGAIQIWESAPVFRNNKIVFNTADAAGGGVWIGGVSNTVFNGDIISNNKAGNGGGGVICWQNTVTNLKSVTFKYNQAQWGGAIDGEECELQVENCYFSDNHVSIWGGGISGNSSNLQVTNSEFMRDTSDWGSGGIHLDHSTATIMKCTFEENKAVFGGGIHFVFSQVSSVKNEFIANVSDNSAGIHVENSDCTINECVFKGNKALNGASGAIDYTADSTIFGRNYEFILTKSEIKQNAATMQFGGARVEQFNTDTSIVNVVVDSCQFIDNLSDVYGSLRLGGLMENFVVSNSVFSNNKTERYTSGPGFVSEAKGTVYNCIFSSNYSQYTDSTKTIQGATVQEANVDFINCTFSDTSTADGNSLSLRRGAIASLTNCILWGCGNRPIVLTTVAELGCTVNVNYCDVENGMDSLSVSDSQSVIIWGEGNINEDPLFADRNSSDFHLQNSSPCIGAGISSILLNDVLLVAPSTDIEGNIRPNPMDSEVDMGAYENEGGTPVSNPVIANEETIIYQNYPNPVKNWTTFKYRLSSPCYAELNIYNIFGQKVRCLVAEKHSAGTYTFKGNMNQFKPGQYFFQLRTNSGFVQTRKLILIE